MKQKKELFRWLTAIVLSVLVLALAGCGSDSGGITNPPPAKVAGVAASAQDAAASVTWTASSDAASYNIYYAATSGVTTANGTKVTGGASGQAITGLANGTRYYFVVTAVNANGESVISDEVSATPLPPLPAKVQGVVLSGGDAQATISWTAAAGATAYNIYWSTTAGVTPTNGTKIAGAVNGVTLTGLANDTTYYYIVVAENLAGEGPASTQKSVTPAAAPQPPGSPTGVTATAGAGQVTVAWAPVTVASSYNVYYLESVSAPTTATVISTGTKLSGNASPLVVTGLTTGSNYWFTVTAVNAGGESAGQTNPKKGVPL